MRHTTAASFLLAVVTLVLPAAPVSAARVLYVAGNGTDNGQCGPATRACRSLGQALALASQGDRIVVGPGTYVGFQLTKAVTLESALGAGATVIQGSEPVIDVIAGAAGAVIGRPSKGFTIRGAHVGIHVAEADVVVEDSIFTGVRLCVLTEFSATGERCSRPTARSSATTWSPAPTWASSCARPSSPSAGTRSPGTASASSSSTPSARSIGR